MKNALFEIIKVVCQHAKAICILLTLTGLIIGFCKRELVINNKYLPIAKRGEGIILCLLYGMLCPFVFFSVIFITYYFNFNLIDITESMYVIILCTGLLIGLVLNFKLLYDSSRQKQLKGVINVFTATFAIVVMVFVCSQIFVR